VIQLKRFDSVGRKLKTAVKFAMNLAVQTVFQNNPVLRLQSVIIHSGSTINGGHYFGYHRLRSRRQTFLYANDKVTEVLSEEKFADLLQKWYGGDESAYLLIYESLPRSVLQERRNNFSTECSISTLHVTSPDSHSSYAMLTTPPTKKQKSVCMSIPSTAATTQDDSQSYEGENFLLTPLSFGCFSTNATVLQRPHNHFMMHYHCFLILTSY
jgi:hypothetical protein